MQGNPWCPLSFRTVEEKETLQAYVESIFEKTAYKNYEIIIVEINSSSEEIFRGTTESFLEDPKGPSWIRWTKDFNLFSQQ